MARAAGLLRGLGPAEALAAIGVAVAAVAAIGADHRPAVAAVDVNWTILGTIWLLALVALSRPARVWVPGALLIFGVHAVFVVRSLGGSPLGLARVTAGGYAALIVPALSPRCGRRCARTPRWRCAGPAWPAGRPRNAPP